ncbi:MAG: PD-(D/E)XK nuclease family protein [Nitrospira sp.]|nr:PD-(D/E)XK nuclease family protein [Nitrospira sp.]
MKVVFGLHLDGEHGWRPANRLGEPVLGPLGLLNLLETRVGLPRAECTQAQRITQYRECLKRCDTPERFYHASFAVDPIGVSASLLSWRDEWYLGGWNGNAPPGAELRIGDIAAVEKVAREVVFPSLGERLGQLAEALSGQKSGIETLKLVDSVEAFSKRWREVLAKLPVQSPRAYEPQASEHTVLGKLQRVLKVAHEGKKPNGKVAWSDDGSLRVVCAETSLLAARWVAQLLTAHQQEVAIVAEHDGSLLDATFNAADVPRQGCQDSSPLVPALQVLPLALAIIWEPLDVYALLEFLSHPIGPVPGYVRRRLAEVIAETPGIGGPRWRETIDHLERQYPDRVAEIRDSLAGWIEHPRYSPMQGAPIATVLERIWRVRDYFQAGMYDQDSVLSLANATGYRQAMAVAASLEALAAQGETSIKPVAIETLVAHCTGRGAPNFAMHAQVGCVPSASNPAAVIEPFDQVIWWQMGAPSLPNRYPWSRRELDMLARAGVELPPLDKVLAHQSHDWLRPILSVRKQLVLVLPPPGVEVHPIWLEIQGLISDLRPEPLEVLVNGHAGKDLQQVAHVPLPQRRRWWQLPREVAIARRPSESYSSLNLFLNAPHQWVLKYAARLNPSNLLAVTDENRLYGNLAHRIVDRFFHVGNAHELHGDALAGWLLQEFESVVAEEGAVLLMPGRRMDREWLRAALGRALEEIQRQFSAAGIVVVESERSLTGKFAGGNLEGQADLVVRKQAGGQAIVDMKWAGANTHKDRLAKNRHLQLALYAELLRQETGTWPEVAYFILEASRLLAPDATFFPQAQTVQSNSTGTTQQLWDQLVATWRWRRSQIDGGKIEIAVEDIEPTPDSEAPPGALVPEALSEEYDEYRWLVGWEN